jgi:hypothetical protein
MPAIKKLIKLITERMLATIFKPIEIETTTGELLIETRTTKGAKTVMIEEITPTTSEERIEMTGEGTTETIIKSGTTGTPADRIVTEMTDKTIVT